MYTSCGLLKVIDDLNRNVHGPDPLSTPSIGNKLCGIKKHTIVSLGIITDNIDNPNNNWMNLP